MSVGLIHFILSEVEINFSLHPAEMRLKYAEVLLTIAIMAMNDSRIVSGNKK